MDTSSELYLLKDVISLFEEKDVVYRADLKSIGFNKAPKIWVQANRFENVASGGYRLTEEFYKTFRHDYQEGILRQDKNTFTPKLGVSEEQWKPKIKGILESKARIQNLLIDDIQFAKTPNALGAYEYTVLFHPARYDNVYPEKKHLLLDYLVDNKEKHLLQARINEGRGRWLEGAYRRQIVNFPPIKAYDSVLTDVIKAVEKQYGTQLGTILTASETHRLLDMPRIGDASLRFASLK